jgi:hypothetical protein
MFQRRRYEPVSDSLQDCVAQNVATKEQLVMFNRRGKLMKPFRIPALCLISALAIAAPQVDAQTNARVGGNSPHVAASGGIARGPINFRTINTHPARMIAQPRTNFRSGYAPLVRPSNVTLAVMNARQTARTYNGQPYNAMAARSDIAPNLSSIAAAQRVIKTDDTEAIAGILARREPAQSDPATANPQTGVQASQPTSGNLAPREAPQSGVKPDPQGKNNHLSFLRRVALPSARVARLQLVEATFHHHRFCEQRIFLFRRMLLVSGVGLRSAL